MEEVRYLLFFISLSLYANIIWQPAEVVSEGLGLAAIDANTVAVDTAGNAINVFTYEVTIPFLTVATVHTKLGTSWGGLISDVNDNTAQNTISVFPGETGQFVAVLQNLSTGDYRARTIALDGTLGDMNTVATSGYIDSDNADVASTPSGDAMLLFSNSGRDSSSYSFYTAEADTWSTPVNIAQGQDVLVQLAAVDASTTYGIAAVLNDRTGVTAFRYGSGSFSSFTTFDSSIDTDSFAFTAQLKQNTTDGMFMVAYFKTDGNVYAQVKPAGSTTTLTNLGQISESSANATNSLHATMNLKGDAIVAWLNDSNELLTTKYTAATNSFATPTVIDTSVNRIHGLSTDLNGNFHIFYIVSGTAYENYSRTMLETANTWRSAILINTNPPGTFPTNIGFMGTTNPRGTNAAYTWGLTNLTVNTAFGIGPPPPHTGGASSAPPPRNTFYRLRPRKHPFR